MSAIRTVKAVSIPDRKNTDRYGNPTRWILKIVKPDELRDMIAFPIDFRPEPNREYYVDIVELRERYAKVRLHRCVNLELVDRTMKYFVWRCRDCNMTKSEPMPKQILDVIEGYEEYLRDRILRHRRFSALVEIRRKLEDEIEKLQNVMHRSDSWWVVEELRPVVADRIYTCKRYRVPVCVEGDRGQCITVYDVAYGLAEVDDESDTPLFYRVCEQRHEYTVDAYIAEGLLEYAKMRLEELKREEDRIDTGRPWPVSITSLFAHDG